MASPERNPVPRRAGAFTLIEILVVVAILALLIAILLPSLARAREQARTVVCASQLREVGHGLGLYGAENRGALPGPIHPAMELETYHKSASEDYEGWHLPSFLRRYFTEKSRTGHGTDKVVSCPTALLLSANRLHNIFGLTDYRRPFTYALNNWKTGYSIETPYGTNPPWYFGWPDVFWLNSGPPFQASPAPSGGSALEDWRDARPKKMEGINQVGREWAAADAFRRDDAGYAAAAVPGKKDGQWRRGTYQFSFVTTDNLIPREPYHSGGINVLAFDTHVEWQRPWRGTINPK